MMHKAIKNFNKQFEYEPVIENADKLEKPCLPAGRKDKFIVAGIGGSLLTAKLLKIWKPDIDLIVYGDYDLPDKLEDRLLIVSSYSGNTEEAVYAFKEGIKRNIPMVVISVGGKLIELAKEHTIPYIEIPDTNIQPRSALGYSLRAFLKVIGEEKMLKATKKLSETLNPQEYEVQGKALVEKLKGLPAQAGKVPVIYSSARNEAIAYNWKIKFNETGKSPAFYNVFPELNHNEIQGYEIKKLSDKFYFIILRDEEDNSRILKRMEVLEKMYKDKGMNVEVIEIEGKDKYHKVFASLILADWIAYYTAQLHGLDAEQVPMIEKFKRLIK